MTDKISPHMAHPLLTNLVVDQPRSTRSKVPHFTGSLRSLHYAAQVQQHKLVILGSSAVGKSSIAIRSLLGCLFSSLPPLTQDSQSLSFPLHHV